MAKQRDRVALDGSEETRQQQRTSVSEKVDGNGDRTGGRRKLTVPDTGCNGKSVDWAV
ncbi:MAG: hypothetical protein WC778_08415 [Negativicutes bacterium]